MDKTAAKDRTILVTWDFTIVSEYALEHAIRIAKTLDKEIRLIHVLKSKDDGAGIAEIENRMQRVVDDTRNQHGVKIDFVTIPGSIFFAISKYASENEVNMVIMGTHGIKGSQKVLGSWALKVIVGSSVPFIVVQDKPVTNAKYSNLVFPVDFKSENKEKLHWAIFMGKYFNSRIHLFVKPGADKHLQRKVDTNLNFAVRFLVQNKLDYEIHEAESKKPFKDQVITFSQNINADLILVMTTKYITILDYMFSADEQEIIANKAKIPVMALNPKANFATMGQFMYGK
jgi:nucleotide-binding universal stress UspA family protein